MGDQTSEAITVPVPLKGGKTVTLESGELVTIQKWSFTRMLDVMEFMEKELSSVKESQADRIFRGNYIQGAMATIQLLGSRIIGLLKMSVAAEDVDKISQDMSADDVMELAVVLVDLNFTEKFVGNLMALWARFQPKLTAPMASPIVTNTKTAAK